MRGEDLGRAYPSILEASSTGQTSSQVWLSRQRSEQLLVSYAPVRGEGGKVVGILVAGTPLNDERLSLISQATSGQALTVGIVNAAAKAEIIAEGTLSGQRAVFEAIRERAVLERAAASLQAGRAIFDADEAVYAAEPLQGYSGQNVLLVAALPHSRVPSVAALLWPLFGVTLLGILLVVGGGIFLGNYISEPIEQLEEGLLSIINGRTSQRFDIEHPDLGGLVFRINSLLNALMGVPDLDADGRTSQPPGAPYREAEGP
jgi:methyl-accepting chemotaxis protein